VSKRDFPRIHFYDQDFVDIYDRTWTFIQECMEREKEEGALKGNFFSYPGSPELTQMDAVFSPFFLVYSNRLFQSHAALDIFYEHQEENGAIRASYNIKTGEPVISPDNPEGVGMPVFPWVEFNLFHKGSNKRRLKEVFAVLTKYDLWIDENFKAENGLYKAPRTATGMWNAPREKAVYPIDFNAMMALNVLYMFKIADLLNDKDASFLYKKQYFALKTRINNLMWNEEDGFYYDLDAKEAQIRVKTIASYWMLLSELPNAEKAGRLIEKLQDPQYFGSPNPFPSVALNEECFRENGEGYRGSVFPHLNFIVIKGLEKYFRWDLAREFAIRHLYYVLDSMVAEGKERDCVLYEAYLTKQGGAALRPQSVPPGEEGFPRRQYLTYAALSAISLMVENIVGLNISLPRKTVDWTIPNLEIMGIENLALKKNLITIRAVKSPRGGWEIKVDSEKLYYFTINIIGKKKKTLPIPSGTCSLLIDKL